MLSYPTDQAAIAAILDCGARLSARGLVAGNDGNLSVRVGDDAVWTTPSGVSKGRLHANMLVKIKFNGTVLAGSFPPSSEVKLHLALYHALPDIRAVVHAHPPAATAFAAAGLALDRPVLQEAVLLLGAVPLVPYALPGSVELAQSIVPYCRHARALLLEYHGALTWGSDMEGALFRMETLEQYATVSLHLRTLGSTRTLPPQLCAELEALRAARGL